MRKYSAELKIQICEAYLSGKNSARELCKICWPNLKQPPGIFWSWISRYRKLGMDFGSAKRIVECENTRMESNPF